MSGKHTNLDDIERKATAPGFGDIFRQKRVSVGYGMDEVAIITGLTTTEIRAVECGGDVSPRIMARLKRVLNLS
ncbi:hypothetical protein [Rhizobium sp. ZPR3]|uniref:XRE family transcriptional regulator n=2 Tax=unclassified Rhizobium TaxID=2613769 RepID=A0AAU7SR60_9HYPH